MLHTQDQLSFAGLNTNVLQCVFVESPSSGGLNLLCPGTLTWLLKPWSISFDEFPNYIMMFHGKALVYYRR